MKKLIVSLVFVLATVPLIAGGNITLEIADNYFSRLAYNKAATYYKKYLEKNEDDTAVWQKLAICYEKTNEYELLETTLAGMVKMEGEIEPWAYLAYAEVLQILDKRQEAVNWYGNYLEKMPNDRRAQNQLAACKQDVSSYADKLRYKIENMKFNSAMSEYGPNIFNNTLLYTTTSPDDNTGNKIHSWTGQRYSDIRQFQRDSLEIFILFNEVEKVNTNYNDGIFCIDPISDRFYYSRNNYNPYKSFNKKGLNSQNHMNLKIYIAENDLGRIIDVKEFAHNDKEYNTAHPTINKDGQIMVFVSDRPDTSATNHARDLFYCTRKQGGWNEPVRLTSSINTEGDEVFPRFHEDGSLYFSSDGLGSLGGLDIYRAKVDFENNQLIKLERLNAEINSTYDDFGIVFEKKRRGYFTSDRPGGKGKDDIYSFVDLQRVLNGKVVHKETGEIIPNAQVVVNNGSVDLFNGTTDEKGAFSTVIYANSTYDLTADSDGFRETKEQLNTNKYHGTADIEMVLKLAPVVYQVQVLDAINKVPLIGVNVEIEFGCGRAPISVQTNISGTKKIPVALNCEYKLKAKKNSYLAENVTWTSPSTDSDETIIIYLGKVSYAPVTLNNIYYDFNKDEVRINEASADLEKLVGFMKDNPELTIQINSHTDARGSDVYNFALSQRRAQAVVDYLIARNVNRNRLQPIGFGESLPVNHCVNGVKCPEEAHQQNRRTQFQVVNTDGSTKINSDARMDIRTDPCKNCPF